MRGSKAVCYATGRTGSVAKPPGGHRYVGSGTEKRMHAARVHGDVDAQDLTINITVGGKKITGVTTRAAGESRRHRKV